MQISRSIQVVLKFQRLEYSFEPVPIIQRYLSKIPLPEEKDIYDVSIKREAKNAEDTTFAVAIGTVFY